MAWRRFVLEPAAEVADTMLHPPTGWTIAQLLQHLDDTPAYLAVTGPIGVGKTHLAEGLARVVSARLIAEQINALDLERFYRDPAGTGWAMELEFLQQRTHLLAADGPQWQLPEASWVSDFWFGQSAAFAHAWLSSAQQAEFCRRWAEARRSVVRPRLIVLLDAPNDVLLNRIGHRGRAGEESLTAEILNQIRENVRIEVRRPDVGPVMYLTLDESQPMIEEISAAMQSW
jgi:deoxyadenosine/deoxycytidine kinase